MIIISEFKNVAVSYGTTFQQATGNLNFECRHLA